jgi:hypothetical protein
MMRAIAAAVLPLAGTAGAAGAACAAILPNAADHGSGSQKVVRAGRNILITKLPGSPPRRVHGKTKYFVRTGHTEEGHSFSPGTEVDEINAHLADGPLRPPRSPPRHSPLDR